MKSINWNGLYANKFKKAGLIFAMLFIFIDIIERISGMDDIVIIGPIYFTILSLVIAIFSKEKLEDERIQVIRYFALKQTFSIVILSVLLTIAFTRIAHSSFTYYSIIVPMLCYFPIFELANYYNPDFIFKERTSEKGSEAVIVVALTIGLIASVVSLIMYLLK